MRMRICRTRAVLKEYEEKKKEEKVAHLGGIGYSFHRIANHRAIALRLRRKSYAAKRIRMSIFYHHYFNLNACR